MPPKDNKKYSEYRTFNQKPIIQVSGKVQFACEANKKYYYKHTTTVVSFYYKSIVERRMLIKEHKFRGGDVTIIPD